MQHRADRVGLVVHGLGAGGRGGGGSGGPHLSGGVVSPHDSRPQQAAEPSVLTPQVCLVPALTEVNSPSGGVAWPYPSSPQQATEPSSLTPQVYSYPALTDAKRAEPSPPRLRGREVIVIEVQLSQVGEAAQLRWYLPAQLVFFEVQRCQVIKVSQL